MRAQFLYLCVFNYFSKGVQTYSQRVYRYFQHFCIIYSDIMMKGIVSLSNPVISDVKRHELSSIQFTTLTILYNPIHTKLSEMNYYYQALIRQAALCLQYFECRMTL